jgi:hypothetical protein
MKIVHALTGTLLCCFLVSASFSVAQTKNAATDKQRQENLDKLQKKQAKQRAAYNKMTDEQKAVARTKALERKTGISGGTTPVGNKPVKPTTMKTGAKKKPVKPLPASKPVTNATTSKAAEKSGKPQSPAVKKTKITQIKVVPKPAKPAIQPAKNPTSVEKVKK